MEVVSYMKLRSCRRKRSPCAAEPGQVKLSPSLLGLSLQLSLFRPVFLLMFWLGRHSS